MHDIHTYTSDCPITQLAKDPKAFKEKLAALWAELSKDEPEKQERPANLEQLTVMVTRELARRVVHLVNFSREGIATLSPIISQSLRVAADYCTQLADFVVKVTVHKLIREQESR
jgi:perilipin-2